MKTLKTLLTVSMATVAFGLFAADQSSDPNLIAGQRLGKGTPNVVLANPSTDYQDPNLIPQKWGAKHSVQTRVAASSASQDEDTLAAIKKCRGMSSKFKDTKACAEHCAKLVKN